MGWRRKRLQEETKDWWRKILNKKIIPDMLILNDEES